ncbi:helix-turn-helix domain-containing protein [Jeotgalibacillus proteolyticus]|uniref:helix-turn-helix domain-containing protein n=1 Tax=Jeotgalibacillus proteolyticus TaxID=2082395 RepID=UPI003CECFBD0
MEAVIKLKEYRKLLGLTQAELAKGISNRSLISQIEKGLVKPSLSLLRQYSVRLQCELDDLFGGEMVLEMIDVSSTLAEMELLLTNRKPCRHLEADFILLEQVSNQISKQEKALLYYCRGLYCRYYSKEMNEAVQYLEASFSFYIQTRLFNEKIRCANELADLLIELDQTDQSFLYLEAAYKLVIKHKIDGIEQIRLMVSMGMAHAKIGEHRSAIRLLTTAIENSNEANIKFKPGQIHMVLGICFKREGLFEQALEHYEKSLHYYEAATDLLNAGGILTNIGIVHRLLQHYDEAIRHVTYACNVFSELNDPIGQLNASYELAAAHFYRGNHKEVLEIFKRVQKLKKEGLPPFTLVKFLLMAGDAHMLATKSEQALSHYKQAYKDPSNTAEQKKHVFAHVVQSLTAQQLTEQLTDWNKVMKEDTDLFKFLY